MRAFDPDPSIRWLFCLTHPDDELAIAVWIRRLAQAGAEVYLSWTHDTPVREAEAQKLAMEMGVPEDHLFFLHATDGHVADEMVALLPKFQDLVTRVRPDRVIAGAFEQGHIDHDATRFLVAQAFDGPIFEFPLYHSYAVRMQTLARFSDPAEGEILELTSDERQWKRWVAKTGFPSQNIWSILFWYSVGSFLTFRPANLDQAERLRLSSEVDFRKPNHPEKISLAVQSSPTWRQWLAALDRFAHERP